MNKKITKILFITIILFLSMFFINIDEVFGAELDNDGKGYSLCYYTWTLSEIQSGDTVCGQANFSCKLGLKKRPYKLGVVAYRNNGYIYSYAKLGCGEKGLLDTKYSRKTTGTCTIDNYKEVFGNFEGSGTADLFYKSGRWTCPKTLYVEVDALCGTLCDHLTLSFTNYNARWKASLGERGNKSVQKGAPPKDVEVNNFITNEEDTETEITDGGGNSIQGGDDTEKNGADKKGITGWGNKGEDNLKDHPEQTDCGALYKEFEQGKSIRSFLNNAFWIICIIGIILLIIMTMIDFIKAITNHEDNGLTVAFKHAVYRGISVIILLMLPVVLTAIINIINKESGSKFSIGANGEVLCEIGQ